MGGIKYSSKMKIPSKKGRSRRLAQLRSLKRKLQINVVEGGSNNGCSMEAGNKKAAISTVPVETLKLVVDDTSMIEDDIDQDIVRNREKIDTQGTVKATTKSEKLAGRRIVALRDFLEHIISTNTHAPFSCSLGDCTIVDEKVSGLESIVVLQCKMCNIQLNISTDYKEGTELNVNDAATLGIISAGIGFSTACEYMSVLNIPFMAPTTFNKCQNNISDAIHQTLWQQMEENGKKEATLARIHGDVDADGIPIITVIADGAWSKRSYNVNYNALSGVACIIGNRTRKVLFLGIRNKYCCVCARAENKKMEPIAHICFKNFSGPSTAMESDIILEGFKRSLEMHGVKYMRLIGDGDSSISKKLAENRPYGACSMVDKIECSNHLLRNFSKHLRELTNRKRSESTNVPVSPQLRKILTARMYRLVAAVKKAVKYRSEENVSLREQISHLIEDMRNAPSHVFGEHKKCNEINYFHCENAEDETNYVEVMSNCGLYQDIQQCFKRLIDNASSLILNMTNNVAEQYNSIVCKFVGGKRINFSQKRSYQTRCEAAAVAFNSGSDYHRVIHKQLIQKSPHSVTKKWIEKMERRKSYYEKAKLCRKQLHKAKGPALPDEHYGAEAVQAKPDLCKEEYSLKAKEFLSKMQKTPDEIKQIEEDTRGQAGNPLWYKERANRITASYFKNICSMRKQTSCVNKVCNLLYGSFKGNSATKYGRRNEIRAIHDFEKQYDVTVQPCGFFIDPEHCMFGASPDGLIGDDGIIAVKCPANIANFHPEEAIKQKRITCATLNEENSISLKHNHAYYYQVQGQLHITRRKFCYFVIWSPLGICVETIERSDQFWQNEMEKQLTSFFYKCLLPEIIDPRKTRGMEIRNPARDI